LRAPLLPLLCLAPLLAACESSSRLAPFDNPFGRSDRVAVAPPPQISPAPTPRVESAPLPSVTQQELAPPPGVPSVPGVAAPGSAPIDPDASARLEPPPVPSVATPSLPAPPPVAQPERVTQSSVTGNWQAREAGGTSCRVTLSSSPKLDLYGASTSGCQSKDLQRVTAWEMRGEDVYLYEPGGAVAARFKAQTRRMDGTLAKSGAPLTLSK